MAGLVVPAIHVLLLRCRKKDVDARDKRGHDAGEVIRSLPNALWPACQLIARSAQPWGE